MPETLIHALEELEEAYERYRDDPEFVEELDGLARDFVGRPTPLMFAERLTRKWGGANVWFKREDLAHTGAHKINNALGQILLADRMGKTAHHRRDRRGPARRRHRHRRRPLRQGVRRLHGRGGHPSPAAERRADEAARDRGQCP